MSLRILHTEASLGWGGQEIRILTEAAGFLARGHEVVLACPRESRIHGEAERFGVPVVSAAIGRKSAPGLVTMRRVLSRFAPEVVNTHSSTDSWLAALARLSMREAPSLVRTRHLSAPVPANAPTRWLYRSAADYVVTTGDALREQLVRQLGVPPDRITSIPTGIDAERFLPGDRDVARARLGLPASATLVGIVATLRSWKGHRYLLQAFAGLEAPDARLVVVGDGPQRAALEAQAGELGIRERTLFAGDQPDVVPWLQSLDVFALPSYANEGVPQALLQAMFVGVPCVTTDAGAIGQIAVPDCTAVVVPKEDADRLRDAIAALLADRERGARLAAEARTRVLSRYTLEAMLDAMEAVFHSAIAQRRRTRSAR